MLFKHALKVIDIEMQGIEKLKSNLTTSFEAACKLLLNCQGKVIILAIGKSGHIGNKIAATLASTGTPAFAVNAGEASHGDFGMITAQDTVIAISNSGKTQELITLLPLLKRLQTPLIAITGDPASPLAEAADVHLWVEIEKEACPLNLAPTASTTATLVLGDALAIALLSARGFTKEDFAFSHPGGTLGKRLLLRVSDLMVTGNNIPKVSPTCTFKDALIEMTEKRLGMTTIVDKKEQLLGILTDGDLRRVFSLRGDIANIQVQDIMTPHPKVTTPAAMAYEALALMEDYKITSLVVLSLESKVAGIIHMHSILAAGII